MTTRSLIAIVVAVGLFIFGAGYGYYSHKRMKAEEYREIDIRRGELERERDRLMDGGKPGVYHEAPRPRDSRPCRCEPGDPLCSCL